MLQRRTPLRAKPRAKGNRGELAVRDIVRSHGWRYCKRNWQSGGQGGGDLIEGPAGVHLEVKWCERNQIWKWITQATGECRPTDIPVVVMRDNRHPVWWAVAPKHEVDALLELHQGVFTLHVLRQGTTHLWKWIDAAVDDATVCAKEIACVEFSRPGADWWKAIPLDELLALLALRERG